MDRYCPNCKAKIEDGKKFCGNCGFKITDYDDNNENLRKSKNRTKYTVILIFVVLCVTGIAIIFGIDLDNIHNSSSTDINNTERYSSKKSSIVGRWEAVEDTWMSELEFFSDGTYSSDKTNYFGSYTAENGRLRLGGALMSDLVYSYDLDGDTLILYDDYDGVEYRRVY